MVTKYDKADIDVRFTHHPPQNDADVQAHETVRALARDVAHQLHDLLPDSREKSLALTHLEQSVMWANAALARARA